jgi:hypothetical protein
MTGDVPDDRPTAEEALAAFIAVEAEGVTKPLIDEKDSDEDSDEDPDKEKSDDEESDEESDEEVL